MATPNNARCPRCRAKLRINCGPSVTYTCGRCGYCKTEFMDNLTKEFLNGPLFKARRPNRAKKGT